MHAPSYEVIWTCVGMAARVQLMGLERRALVGKVSARVCVTIQVEV
jgi:hypothetical protein